MHVHYDYLRIHKTLRRTPAMAAGVADCLRTVRDIAELLEQSEFAEGSRQMVTDEEREKIIEAAGRGFVSRAAASIAAWAFVLAVFFLVVEDSYVFAGLSILVSIVAGVVFRVSLRRTKSPPTSN